MKTLRIGKTLWMFPLLMGLSISQADASSWNWNGDFRFRHENVNKKQVDSYAQQKVRARFGVTREIGNTLDVGIRLTTGTGITSRDLTFDSDATPKQVGFDLVYMDWRPFGKNLSIVAGKQEQPFYTPGNSELIWDAELTPEGVSVGYDRKLGSVDFAWNFGGFIFDDNTTSRDQKLYGTDMAFCFPLAGLKLHLGGGYFLWDNISDGAVLTSLNGNTEGTTTGTYKYAYKIFEGSFGVGFDVGSLPIDLFFDLAMNDAVDGDNDAWLIGMMTGRGSWSFAYNYRRTNPDAVVGAVTDGSFADGNTDSKGHVFKLGYKWTDKIKTSLKFFANSTKVGIDSNYFKTQLNFNVKL